MDRSSHPSAVDEREQRQRFQALPFESSLSSLNLPCPSRCVVLDRASLLGSVPMEFQDRTLVCIECHQEFVFTAGEQLFYHDKNFKNEPKRCKACKAKRAGSSSEGGPSRDSGGVFPMRAPNHRSFQAHSRTARVLPGVFSEAARRPFISTERRIGGWSPR